MNKGVEKFREGFNCAQSVLYAHCDGSGIDTNTAFKIASGFGGGMGRKGEVCGAVTGGILALGLRYGRGEDGTKEDAEITHAKTRELMERFEKENGNILCRNLLNGCDLATPEGKETFYNNDLHNRVCVKCVESAIRIVEEIKE